MSDLPSITRKALANVSPAVKRLNPELFGVGGLPHTKRQSDQRSQGEDRQLEKGTRGMGFRVSIISVRKKLVDAHDNLRTGAKPLVDAITSTLGFASDDNPRLHWEYGQVISESEGTIVKIDRFEA